MTIQKVDVLLVGGGVMSATLGTLLTRLDPSLRITLVERLDHVAHESPLMLFKDGNVEATKVGALSKSQLAAFLDSNI